MTVRVVKVLPLLACVLTVTATAGCGDACRDLASQVCNCFPDDGTRTVCNQRAKDAESVYSVTAQDEQYCQHLIDTHACDCTKIATEAGRSACGLTLP
jgi:hypothetical protein